MSDTILNHGYVPEEHAPDPVIGHGDPTPPGKVAIWLFLASEVMFFIGLLATYIIFRSGSPKIFAESVLVLNKTLAGVNTLVLIFSSLTMALGVDAAQKGNVGKLKLMLLLTFLCACGFMFIKYTEYKDKLTHHTIVAKAADGKFYVYDGHLKSKEVDAKGDLVSITLQHTHLAERPVDGVFDIHWMTGVSVEKLAEMQAGEGGAMDRREKMAAADNEKHAAETVAAHTPAAAGEHGEEYTLKASDISQNITYGPWKNIFFACYFATTGVHGLHVLGGMAALAILLVHAMRGKVLPAHTEYVGLYWHFVDLVWIFLFPMLYLI